MGIYRNYIESRLIYLKEKKKNIKNDKRPWDLSDIKEVLISNIKSNPLAKESVLKLAADLDIAKNKAITSDIKDKLLNIRFPLSDRQKICEICDIYRDLIKTHHKELIEVLEEHEMLDVSEKIEFLINANRSYLFNLLGNQGITITNPYLQRDLIFFLNEIHLIFDQKDENVLHSFDNNMCARIVKTLFLDKDNLSPESRSNIFLNIVGEEKFREYLNRILTEEEFKSMFGDDIRTLISSADFDKQATIDIIMKRFDLISEGDIKHTISIDINKHSYEFDNLQRIMDNVCNEIKFKDYIHKILTEMSPKFNDAEVFDKEFAFIMQGIKNEKRIIAGSDMKVEKSIKTGLIHQLAMQQKKVQTQKQTKEKPSASKREQLEKVESNPRGILNTLFTAMSNRQKSTKLESAQQPETVDAFNLNSNQKTYLLFQNLTRSRRAQTMQEEKPGLQDKRTLNEDSDTDPPHPGEGPFKQL